MPIFCVFRNLLDSVSFSLLSQPPISGGSQIGTFMPELSHVHDRHGLKFKGKLVWDENGVDQVKISESVHLVAEDAEVFVYGTEFEARLLGAGDREGYLGVMTASIVDAYFNPNIKTALHVRADGVGTAPAAAADEGVEP